MSDQGNSYFKLVKDTILDKSALLAGVDGVDVHNIQKASSFLLGDNSAGTAFTTITAEQLRQAVSSQLVVKSAGAYTCFLAPGGITTVGSPACAYIMEALGLQQAGDGAVLTFLNSGNQSAGSKLALITDATPMFCIATTATTNRVALVAEDVTSGSENLYYAVEGVNLTLT